MNKQQKQRTESDPYTIALHSMFRTIQGEGPYVGRPAVFVRLGGCNLQCPGCDTEYTSLVQYRSITAMVSAILSLKKRYDIVVITGGEPFRQPLALVELCEELAEAMIARGDAFCDIQIETNGTLSCPGFGKVATDVVSIVVSPKTPVIQESLLPWVVAYKYVLSHDDVAPDGLPGRVLGSEHKNVVFRPSDLADPVINIYVQPMDTRDKETDAKNLAAAIDSCMVHGYTLGLQVHKIIGME